MVKYTQLFVLFLSLSYFPFSKCGNCEKLCNKLGAGEACIAQCEYEEEQAMNENDASSLHAARVDTVDATHELDSIHGEHGKKRDSSFEKEEKSNEGKQLSEEEEAEFKEKGDSCWAVCSEICFSYEQRLNLNCLKFCPCKCNTQCKSVCNKYSLGNVCLLKCGCLDDLHENFTSFLTIEEGAAEENSPIAEDVSAEEKSREENSEKENIETIKEEEGMEDKEKPTGVEKSIDDENEESIVESERWIDECANVGNGNTEKIAECVTEFATQNKSFKLLGCVVTCSITSWSNATGFLNCLQHCIRQPNYQHDPNQNKTSPIKPSIKIAGEKIISQDQDSFSIFWTILFLILIFLVVVGSGIKFSRHYVRSKRKSQMKKNGLQSVTYQKLRNY